MLWGRTLRSPHPHARVARGLDVGPALALPGVACVVDRRGRAGGRHVRPHLRRPAGVRPRRGALRGRAGGGGRRRPPRDRPAGAGGHRRPLRAARPPDRRRRRRRRRADPPRRQRDPPHRPPPRRPRCDRRRRRRGDLRGRDAGPGVPGPRVGARHPRRRGRHRPVGRHPVAARGPRPGRRLPPPAARAGAAAPRRGRGRLRRAGGREHAGPRLPAGAGVRAAGEDGLPAGRVVPRPRPPPSGPDALPPPRHLRGRPGQGRGRGGARRRGLRLVVVGRDRQRRPLRLRALPGAQRPGRRHRRADQQPAVRGDAGLRRGAGVLRPRVTDGSPRGRGWASTRSSCGSGTHSAPATCCPPVRSSRARRRWPSASGRRSPTRCPRRPARGGWSGRAAPGAPTTPTARGGGSGSRSATRTSCTRRASTTRPRPGCGWRAGWRR